MILLFLSARIGAVSRFYALIKFLWSDATDALASIFLVSAIPLIIDLFIKDLRLIYSPETQGIMNALVNNVYKVFTDIWNYIGAFDLMVWYITLGIFIVMLFVKYFHNENDTAI